MLPFSAVHPTAEPTGDEHNSCVVSLIDCWACLTPGSACPDPFTFDRQMLPILRCGVESPPLASTCLGHVALTGASHAHASFACMPVTLWLNLPLLSRVTVLIQELARHSSSDAAPSEVRGLPRLSLALYIPRVCVISAVPSFADESPAALDIEDPAYAAIAATMGENGRDFLQHLLMARPGPASLARIKDTLHRLRMDDAKPIATLGCWCEEQWGAKSELRVDNVGTYFLQRIARVGEFARQAVAEMAGRYGQLCCTLFDSAILAHAANLMTNCCHGMLSGPDGLVIVAQYHTEGIQGHFDRSPQQTSEDRRVPSEVQWGDATNSRTSSSALHITVTASTLKLTLADSTLLAAASFGGAIASLQAAFASPTAVSQTSIQLRCARVEVGVLADHGKLCACTTGVDMLVVVNVHDVPGCSFTRCNLATFAATLVHRGVPTLAILTQLRSGPCLSFEHTSR